jgi:hypothetical protein
MPKTRNSLYHSRFIPVGIAEASQILRDAHVLPKLLSYEVISLRDWW